MHFDFAQMLKANEDHILVLHLHFGQDAKSRPWILRLHFDLNAKPRHGFEFAFWPKCKGTCVFLHFGFAFGFEFDAKYARAKKPPHRF